MLATKENHKRDEVKNIIRRSFYEQSYPIMIKKCKQIVAGQ